LMRTQEEAVEAQKAVEAQEAVESQDEAVEARGRAEAEAVKAEVLTTNNSGHKNCLENPDIPKTTKSGGKPIRQIK